MKKKASAGGLVAREDDDSSCLREVLGIAPQAGLRS